MVGASFGGFDALKVLLGALPATFPLPLAIVQHQGSPGSGLSQALLQRYTALVVADAEDKEDLLPGVAYLAPPATTCWSSAAASRSPSTRRSRTPARRSTCCSSPPPTSTAPARSAWS